MIRKESRVTKKVKVWLALAVIFVLVCSAGGLVAALVASKFSSMTESLLAVAAKGDFKNFYDSHTSSDFRRSVTVEQLKSFLSKHHIDTLSHVRTSEFQGGLTAAEWRGAMVLAGGTEVPLLIWYVKENGDWRIVFIASGEERLGVPLTTE